MDIKEVIRETVLEMFREGNLKILLENDEDVWGKETIKASLYYEVYGENGYEETISISESEIKLL